MLRPNEYNDNRFHVDISQFFRHMHVEDFLDSFNTIEFCFYYFEITVEKKIKLVASKLTEGTSIW